MSAFRADCYIEGNVNLKVFYKMGGNTCGLFKHNESKSKGRQKSNRTARIL